MMERSNFFHIQSCKTFEMIKILLKNQKSDLKQHCFKSKNKILFGIKYINLLYVHNNILYQIAKTY